MADGLRDKTAAVVYNNLCVPDTITDCGKAILHLDDGHAHFEIELGPVNAMNLLEFLNALPDEPGGE